MNKAWILDNWALLAAASVVLVIVCVGLAHRLRASARFRLRHARKVLRQKRKILRQASGAVAEAERKVERLQQRADRVKPRHLDEAREAVADARALGKIAHDQVLIAENHLRRIIVQEFPPSKQARLRAKYRVRDVPDKKPFTF